MGLKGLHVSILRSDTDCTGGGVTNAVRGATQALLLGIEDGIYDEADALRALARGTPVLVVVRRQFGSETYVTAKPWGEERHTMAGGNFVYSHDSRYRSSVCQYPISVHDRIDDRIE